MELLKTLLPMAVSGSLMTLVFGIGLDAEPRDVLYLLRRPLKLLDAVLAISLVVPAVTLVVIQLLPLTAPAKAGIVLMALAPVPPFVPGNAIKAGGGKSYVYGLFAAYALLTVVIVPATVELLGRVYHVNISVSAAAIARTMLIGVLAPLAVGMAFRAWKPALAARAAPLVSKIAMGLLVLVLIPILIVAFPAIRAAVGNGSVLAICIIVAAAIAGAHVLGGRDPGERDALGAAAATRHPGIALMIASANGLDRQVNAVVLLFVLVSLAVFNLYRLRSRRRGRIAKA